MPPKPCLRCASTDLEPGGIQATGTLKFRPANTPFLKLTTADVSVAANMCRQCGTIEIVGDVRKLQKLLGSEKAH